MRLLHKVKRSMSDNDFVVLGLALPKSLVILCRLSLIFGSETVPATCRSVPEDLLLLCLGSELEGFTFCSPWLSSLLEAGFTYWYSEALPMRVIPIKTFRAVRLNSIRTKQKNLVDYRMAGNFAGAKFCRLATFKEICRFNFVPLLW